VRGEGAVGLLARPEREYHGGGVSGMQAGSFLQGTSVSESDRSVRVLPLHEQGADRDYLEMTPAERMGIMWQLTVDTWAFKGEPLDESRLPRHVVRVIRGRR
jgi:hypothetical protein